MDLNLSTVYYALAFHPAYILGNQQHGTYSIGDRVIIGSSDHQFGYIVYKIVTVAEPGKASVDTVFVRHESDTSNEPPIMSPFQIKAP